MEETEKQVDQGLTEKQKVCIKCQRCCKDIHILTPYAGDNKDMVEFFSARGFKVYRVPIDVDKKEIRLMVSFEYPCPFLTPAGCAIYPNRPQVCREYDGTKDPFIDCAWKELENANEDSKS